MNTFTVEDRAVGAQDPPDPAAPQWPLAFRAAVAEAMSTLGLDGFFLAVGRAMEAELDRLNRVTAPLEQIRALVPSDPEAAAAALAEVSARLHEPAALDLGQGLTLDTALTQELLQQMAVAFDHVEHHREAAGVLAGSGVGDDSSTAAQV